MAGGPSQFEMFDDKPKLRELDGQVAPDSFFPKDKSFAFIGKGAKLLGSRREFAHHGECGMKLSSLLPHLGGIADDICWLKGMTTDVFNHGPAKLFMNTGFQVPGRPSMGSWVTYGLGSESSDLPGFVVLQSGPRGPRAGNALWSSGFLPDQLPGRTLPGHRRCDSSPDQSGRHRRKKPEQFFQPGRRTQSPPSRNYRRSRDQHPHQGLRNGLPHADQRARADGHRRRR